VSSGRDCDAITLGMSEHANSQAHIKLMTLPPTKYKTANIIPSHDLINEKLTHTQLDFQPALLNI